MHKLQDLILKINSLKENNEYLSYQETLLVFKALKKISVEKVILEKVIRLIYYSKENDEKIKNLSFRESEIFKLIGFGLSSREISNLLSIQETTVSTHRKNIIKKLALSGAGKLNKIAYQHLQSQ
ncbi:MAG: hypothetical protein COB12_07390 [Flavobacterium sp.]|nr:MAG: hypothetical protein COB12_07390 [Flavobacterium sp.]